tara:strand:+ start:5842 stop:7098 length:1257 start_codon:yes stop_codon:yes gene_type:complete
MKTILFIFRSFNDVDHMTPLFDESLNQPDLRILISCINPYFDIKNDFRLNFIKHKHNVKIEYIYNLDPHSLFHKLFILVTDTVCRNSLLNNFGPLKALLSKIRMRLYSSRVMEQLFDSKWAHDLIRHQQIGAVVVDYVDETRFIYSSINTAAKAMSIPIIGVPHGFDSAANDYWTLAGLEKQNNQRMHENWGWIDELIVASCDIKTKYSRMGLNPSKMTVLGSPRFSKKWCETYFTLIGENTLDRNPDSTKIIFFDHSSRYRSHPDDILESLTEIDNLPFTDLVIKPHTREQLSDERLKYIGRIDNSHSTHLIQWSDIVINYMSSIIFDAYYFDKIFIYPNHFNDNTMRWEKYNACWTVNSNEEIVDTINKIHLGQFDIPYSSTNVNTFLFDQVYGSSEDQDVSTKYLTHIKSLTQAY